MCVCVCSACVSQCVCVVEEVGAVGDGGKVKERKLPLVFSSLGSPDGKSFFIRLEAALHICRPRCLMNTEAGRAVASLILHSRGEPGRPGCVVPPPPTASRCGARAERSSVAVSSGPGGGSWRLAGTKLPHFVGLMPLCVVT